MAKEVVLATNHRRCEPGDIRVVAALVPAATTPGRRTQPTRRPAGPRPGGRRRRRSRPAQRPTVVRCGSRRNLQSRSRSHSGQYATLLGSTVPRRPRKSPPPSCPAIPSRQNRALAGHRAATGTNRVAWADGLRHARQPSQGPPQTAATAPCAPAARLPAISLYPAAARRFRCRAFHDARLPAWRGGRHTGLLHAPTAPRLAALACHVQRRYAAPRSWGIITRDCPSPGRGVAWPTHGTRDPGGA